MANPNKTLGTGLENRVVKRAQARGIEARRQPGSGVYKDHPNDVVLKAIIAGCWGQQELLGECKVRSTPPSLAQLMSWLAGAEENAREAGMYGAFLVYNAKGSRNPRVLIDLDTFLDILAQIRATNS